MKESTERDLAVADELGRMADDRIRELEAERKTQRQRISLLLRYVDHRKGCASYTNGPCTCGLADAMRDL